MKAFKALLLGLILFPSVAFADTVICRGGGCPPEATSVGLSTGITKAIAGPNISLSPVSGIGEVTITGTAGSVGSAGDSISSATMTRVSGGITNSYQVNGDTKAYQTATQFVIKSSLTVENTITSTNPIAAPVPAAFVQPGSLNTSVMASSVSAQSVNGRSIKSTNDATDGLVPKFDAATGGVTWSADNAGGSGSSDNFGTHTSSKVIDAAGFAITRVSSIVFNSGTSPIIAGMISSAAANTIVDATQINATNKGTNKLLGMNGDNTLSFFTDQTSAGGGDNMGNHVATMPIVSPYALTVASGTVYGQLSVGSITVVSAGAPVINSTHAVIQVKVTDLSDTDFEVAEDSVSVNGVRVSTYQPNTSAVLANHSLDATGNGNVISFRDQDRFTTPSFASGTFVTYIATPTMGISSSTIGHFRFHNAISSQANFAVYAWIPPSDIDLTANVILSSFGVILGGADTGTQRYVMAISTSMDGRPARETMFSAPGQWLEGINVDVTADAAGANGYLQVVGNTTLTNWQTRIIPGALHYITVARDGDAAQDGSTVDSFSSFFSISYKRRLAQ